MVRSSASLLCKYSNHVGPSNFAQKLKLSLIFVSTNSCTINKRQMKLSEYNTLRDLKWKLKTKLQARSCCGDNLISGFVFYLHCNYLLKNEAMICRDLQCQNCWWFSQCFVSSVFWALCLYRHETKLTWKKNNFTGKFIYLNRNTFNIYDYFFRVVLENKWGKLSDRIDNWKQKW